MGGGPASGVYAGPVQSGARVIGEHRSLTTDALRKAAMTRSPLLDNKKATRCAACALQGRDCSNQESGALCCADRIQEERAQTAGLRDSLMSISGLQTVTDAA